jgi:hypothetical protein
VRNEARAEAGRQPARRRRQEGEEHRRRHERRPGGEGRVVQGPLEEHVLHHHRDVQRAVDEQRGEVDHGEVARREQARRHERPRSLQHEERDRHARRRPERQRGPRHRVLPVALLTARRAERETADRQGDHPRPEPVEVTARILVPALRHAAGGPQRHRDDRHIDEERHAPADRLDQHAAEQRADDERRRGPSSPHADGATARLAIEERGDDRQAARHEQSAGERLTDAAQDEEFHARRQPARHRGEAEPDEADGEHPAPPVVVVERARQDEQRGQDGEVRGRDVGEALEPADEGRRQVPPDRIERDVDDGSVEEHDRRAEDRRDKDGRALAHRGMVRACQCAVSFGTESAAPRGAADRAGGSLELRMDASHRKRRSERCEFDAAARLSPCAWP